MTVETIDGVRVLKLKDRTGAHSAAADDMMTMVHIWRLLSGGHALRDNSVVQRHFL